MEAHRNRVLVQTCHAMGWIPVTTAHLPTAPGELTDDALGDEWQCAGEVSVAMDAPMVLSGWDGVGPEHPPVVDAPGIYRVRVLGKGRTLDRYDLVVEDDHIGEEAYRIEVWREDAVREPAQVGQLDMDSGQE